MPPSIQSWKNATRSIMSSNQEDRGFRLGYPMPPLSQMLGFWLFSIELNMSSSSPVMTMMPLTAFWMSTSVLASCSRRRLKRPYSCVRHVPSDSMRPVFSSIAKLDSCAVSVVSNSGTRSSCKLAISSTCSSGDLPPDPPASRGWMESTMFRSLSDSWLMKVMFALSCMPKTSGCSVSGKVCTNSRHSSTVAVVAFGGQQYFPLAENLYSGSRICGPTYFSRTASRQMRSLSSVTRPP
mmetsp:Transcript_25523/g.76035  ORF Transcript_25523/g.76035 Transcript_25523/m.76035 type:complete len:238 (+) Transcript_25523:377-1090(+)